MVSKIIRQTRADDVLNDFVKKPCVFLTLTTPDVVDIIEIRSRWRSLRHWLQETFPNVKYVMNYEIHPKGHGWHIHGVFTCYIPLTKYLIKIQSYGFGRVGVEKVTSKGVADYLTKHALKAYRGVSLHNRELLGRSIRLRLVNTSRGLPRLSDYKWHSLYNDRFKSIFDYLKPFHLPYKYKLSLSGVLATFDDVKYFEFFRLLRSYKDNSTFYNDFIQKLSNIEVKKN